MRRERCGIIAKSTLRWHCYTSCLMYMLNRITSLTDFLSSPFVVASDNRVGASESPAIINLDICDAKTWSSSPPCSPAKYSTSIWIWASEGDGAPMSRPEMTATHSSAGLDAKDGLVSGSEYAINAGSGCRQVVRTVDFHTNDGIFKKFTQV